MIKLSKGDEPQILQENRDRWEAVLRAKAARGEVASKADLNRYGHAQIKAAIVAETNGKCAYCESKIRHISPGDIEHIAPKSHEIADRFRWENLTLSCEVCNTAKGTKLPSPDTFIDPYVDDPEAAFWWCGPAIAAKPGRRCDAATQMVLDLKLNRDELVSRRQERIENLARHLDLAMRKPEPLKSILIEDFNRELADDREYSALCRSVARSMLSA